MHIKPGFSGFATTSHEHAATDITSATLDTDRFSAYSDLAAEAKIGTGSSQVAAGDHDHSGVYQPLDSDLTDLAGLAGVDGDVIIRSGGAWARLPKGSDAEVLTLAAGLPSWAAPAAPSAHDILSATHGDTTPSAVARGDIVTGQGGTPKWAALAKGTAGYVLTMGADEPEWATPAAPAAHALDGAVHTVAGLTTGHFLKATGATTFGFGAHGLTAGDVGADPAGTGAGAVAAHELAYTHANYDTAYGWGDHAGLYDLAGTGASEVAAHELAFTHANYDTAYGWGDHAGLYDPAGTASSEVGTHESTYNHSNYNTAYGWGDHAGLYTAASHATTEDAINGLVKVDGAGAYSAVTDNSGDWDTAYGWGDHSGAGYLTDIVSDASPQLGADLDPNGYGVSIVMSPTAGTGGPIIGTVTVDTNGVGIGCALVLSADGHYDEANAALGSAIPCTAMALETGVGSKKVLFYGVIKVTGWTLTVGGLVYLGETTGALTQVAPSDEDDVVQPIGIALAADVLFFNPSLMYLSVTV